MGIISAILFFILILILIATFQAFIGMIITIIEIFKYIFEDFCRVLSKISAMFYSLFNFLIKIAKALHNDSENENSHVNNNDTDKTFHVQTSILDEAFHENNSFTKDSLPEKAPAFSIPDKASSPSNENIECKTVSTPLYNPLQPQKGFYRTEPKKSSFSLESFMIECNAQLEKEEQEEEYKRYFGIKPQRARSFVHSPAGNHSISYIKKNCIRYPYKDDRILKFSNTRLTDSEIEKALNSKINLKSNLSKTLEQFYAVLHIYFDYGFITVKMISYGLSISSSRAYKLLILLFGEELPVATSTIDNSRIQNAYSVILEWSNLIS